MESLSYVGHHDAPFGKIKNKSNKFIKKNKKNMSKDIKVLIGSRFGNKVFMIETGKVGTTDHLIKEEGGNIRTAKFATVNGTEVNSLRTMEVAGGNKVIVVNGGEKEIKLHPATDMFVEDVSKYVAPEAGEKRVFGSYKDAVEIANASNQFERKRLKEIIEKAKAELEALEKVIELNDSAKALYID